MLGKFYLAIGQGEKRIIGGPLDVFSGVEFGAALFDDNHAWFDDLAVMNFHAEPLGGGIAAKSC